jgi:hypothetical protein
MKNNLMNLAFIGSGLTGIIDGFVNFANTYFVAISCLILLVSAIYKFDKAIKTKEYKKTNVYCWFIYIKDRLKEKKNVNK